MDQHRAKADPWVGQSKSRSGKRIEITAKVKDRVEALLNSFAVESNVAVTGGHHGAAIGPVDTVMTDFVCCPPSCWSLEVEEMLSTGRDRPQRTTTTARETQAKEGVDDAALD